MRELARRGGLKSGVTRWENRIMWFLWQGAAEQGMKVAAAIIDYNLLRGGFYKEPNRSGGSHDTDWRCPECGHFSSIKNRACAKCRMPGPTNGRLTRKALREREKEHKAAAYLKRTADADRTPFEGH